MSERIVIGVGNMLMGDDGLGEAVIERLEDGRRLPGVKTYNAGTTAFLALEAMSGFEEAVVVDTIATGATPGTIHRYRYEDGAFAGEIPEMTMHDVSFTEALAVGDSAYDIPPKITILGVEPASIEFGIGLSDVVASRIDEVIDTIAAEFNVPLETHQ